MIIKEEKYNLEFPITEIAGNCSSDWIFSSSKHYNNKKPIFVKKIKSFKLNSSILDKIKKYKIFEDEKIEK